MRKYFLAALLASLSFAPFISQAALVTCNGPVAGNNLPACDSAQLFVFVNGAINYMILFAFPVVACIFAYAGFLLITETGSPATFKKAWGLIQDAALGFCIMLLAWVAVRFIFDNLLTSTYSDVYQTLFSGH